MLNSTRGLAVLAAILLTFVCRNSAANTWGLWGLPVVGCDVRNVIGDPVRDKLASYDKVAWIKHLDKLVSGTGKVPKGSHSDLIAGMPAEMRKEMLFHLADVRKQGRANKRILDLMFDVLDRADTMFTDAKESDGEAVFRRYFAHEAAYFSPLYDADLVLAVARAIHSALPKGVEIAFGGSFVNAKADLKKVPWDVDTIGLKVPDDVLDRVKAAVAEVFKDRGITPPTVDFHKMPMTYFQLNFVYFEIHGGGMIHMWMLSPLQPDNQAYMEPTGFTRHFELSAEVHSQGQ